MKDENEDGHSKPANGKIDVEAPSPSHFRCESSAHQRPEDGRNTEDCTHKALQYWSFVEGHEVHDDDHGSREDAGGASTSNCAANDKGSGVGSSATYCRADFEQSNGVDEDPLGVVKCVDSAHDELKGAASEHVGAGIPSNVVERVEFICDCRNGGYDDCAVLCSD